VFQDGLPPFQALNEDIHFLDPFNNFTLIDRIKAANYAKVSLINRFYAQGLASPGARSVREVAHLILSQGIDMRQGTEAHGQLVGPLDIDLDFRLGTRGSLESRLRLAPSTGTLQEVLLLGSLTLWPGTSLSIANYQRQSPVTQYLQGVFTLSVLEGARVSYIARYDVLTEEFREHNLLVHYEGVCYRLDASFRFRKAGENVFQFQINFLNL
jgi:hypothetical protein